MESLHRCKIPVLVHAEPRTAYSPHQPPPGIHSIMQSRIPAYLPCFNAQDPCVEGDPLLIDLIDRLWHSISILVDQQVEKSVPCVIIPICTVARLIRCLCVTSGEPFAMLIMTFKQFFF